MSAANSVESTGFSYNSVRRHAISAQAGAEWAAKCSPVPQTAAPFHKLHPRIHPRKLETSEVCLSHFHLSFLPVCTQSNYINSSLRNVSQTHMLTDLLFVKILFH